MTLNRPPTRFSTATFPATLSLLIIWLASLVAAAEAPPQPPPGDGGRIGGLEGTDLIMVLLVFFWVSFQVPVALMIRMDANRRGMRGTVWFLAVAFPVLGYATMMMFLWARSRSPLLVEGKPRFHEVPEANAMTGHGKQTRT